METFPDYLPNPNTDFAGSNDANALRTQMTTGRFRQRNRFSQELRTMPVSWKLTDFEFGMFQSWHLHKLNGGNDWFNINLPLGGDGLESAVARFIEGKYAYKYTDFNEWTINGSLECEDALVWSEEDYDALVAVGDLSAIEDEAASIAIYVST